MASNPDYASYLLRLKYIRNDRCASWVATLQSTATGAQRSFTGLEALIDFLQTEFDRREDKPCERLPDHPSA